MTDEELDFLMDKADEMTDRLTKALFEGEDKENGLTVACMTFATAQFTSGVLLAMQKASGISNIFEEYMKMVNYFMNKKNNEKQMQEIKESRDQLDMDIKELKKKIKESRQNLEYQKKNVEKLKQIQMDSFLSSIMGDDDNVN